MTIGFDSSNFLAMWVNDFIDPNPGFYAFFSSKSQKSHIRWISEPIWIEFRKQVWERKLFNLSGSSIANGHKSSRKLNWLNIIIPTECTLERILPASRWDCILEISCRPSLAAWSLLSICKAWLKASSAYTRNPPFEILCEPYTSLKCNRHIMRPIQIMHVTLLKYTPFQLFLIIVRSRFT